MELLLTTCVLPSGGPNYSNVAIAPPAEHSSVLSPTMGDPCGVMNTTSMEIYTASMLTRCIVYMY